MAANHAKLIVADERRALVGSMNIDRSAFDLRRELGMVVEAPDAVARLTETLQADWDVSSRYHAPDRWTWSCRPRPITDRSRTRP